MQEVNYNFEVPLNNISFGQTSVVILRELFNRGIKPPLIPISNTKQIDISAQAQDEQFNQNLNECLKKQGRYCDKTFKLWHINGSVNSLGREQTLLTFHETDSLTQDEVNILSKSKNIIVTSTYSQRVFEEFGIDTHYVPLAFDSWNFRKLDKKYHNDDRITFSIVGKMEHRKRTVKTIKTWLQKYGNSKKYFLQVAAHNPFLKPEDLKECYQEALGGKIYSNITFFDWMPTNVVFNDFLNSTDIILAMSGAEAFGLPEFHATALGKHCVGHYATGYKSWMNPENAVLVNSSSKITSHDGKFFMTGDRFNQGSFYDWAPDMFLAACDEAIRKHEANPVNEAGLLLQEKFSTKRMVDSILQILD